MDQKISVLQVIHREGGDKALKSAVFAIIPVNSILISPTSKYGHTFEVASILFAAALITRDECQRKKYLHQAYSRFKESMKQEPSSRWQSRERCNEVTELLEMTEKALQGDYTATLQLETLPDSYLTGTCVSYQPIMNIHLDYGEPSTNKPKEKLEKSVKLENNEPAVISVDSYLDPITKKRRKTSHKHTKLLVNDAVTQMKNAVCEAEDAKRKVLEIVRRLAVASASNCATLTM